MILLTAQKKAKMYAKLYIDHYNFGDFLKATKEQGLSSIETEVAWESIDQYEDMRPEDH